MENMFALSDIPCLYTVIAVVVSAYQAYRGFEFQRILADKAQWRKPQQKVVLLCIADMILYLVCTFTGFISLFFAYIGIQRSDISEISTGSALLLVFLTLYGILGVTGQLPHLLQQGKYPFKAG